MSGESCSVNCLERPDAVDKINWKCTACGTNLEQACKDRQKASAEYYKHEAEIQKEIEKEALKQFNELKKKLVVETKEKLKSVKWSDKIKMKGGHVVEN